jgi:hypothetical protein
MRTGNAKQGTVTRHVIAISRGITATATRRSNETFAVPRAPLVAPPGGGRRRARDAPT